MNDQINIPEKKPIKPFWLLLIGAFIGVLLTLGGFGIVRLASRPRIPANVPTEVEVLPEDPQKVPLFSSEQASLTLSKSGAATAALSGDVAILVDPSSGDVLAAKNDEKRFYPASITKVMTLIVACERLSEENLLEKVTMTEELYNYVRTGGYKGTSLFGINIGNRLKIRDLLFGTGVQSFSDCAILLVRKLATSEEEFVGWMNEKAASLGMKNTHFDNIIGYESDNNYSTVQDLIIMLEYALRCDLIKDILSTHSCEFYFETASDSGEYRGYFNSTLFKSNGKSRIDRYEKDTGKTFSLAKGKLIGGKTGTLTYYSLASFAEIGGKTYLSIVGDSPTPTTLMTDVKALYDTYAK